jgi:hypothetical protein
MSEINVDALRNGKAAKKQVASVLVAMWDRDRLQDEYLSLAGYAGAIMTASHHASKSGLQEMDVYALEQTGLLFGRLAKKQAQTEQPSMAFRAAQSMSWPGIALGSTGEACGFFGIIAERVNRLRQEPWDTNNAQILQLLFKGLGEQARAKARSLTYDEED